MKIDGGCHCGAITYRATVDPEKTLICHCTDCQTLTGTAFRVTVPVPEDQFEITKGAPKIYIKTGSSGAKRARQFLRGLRLASLFNFGRRGPKAHGLQRDGAAAR